jgi:hypothetical protein
MQKDDAVKRITNTVNQLLMQGIRPQEIAMALFQSKLSPITTIGRGGDLQLSSIDKVACSMNKKIYFFFADADHEDPKSEQILRDIHDYNIENFFELIEPSVKKYLNENKGLTMKSGLVKRAKAREIEKEIQDQLLFEIDNVDID